MSWRAAFTAKGSSFYPSRLSLPYVSAHDPQQTSSVGAEKPEFGVANFELKEQFQGRECLAAICQLAADLKPRLLAAGAESFTIWIYRDYHEQCNEWLSPDELSALAALGCSLGYSAYCMEREDGT